MLNLSMHPNQPSPCTLKAILRRAAIELLFNGAVVIYDPYDVMRGRNLREDMGCEVHTLVQHLMAFSDENTREASIFEQIFDGLYPVQIFSQEAHTILLSGPSLDALLSQIRHQIRRQKNAEDSAF